LCAATGAKRYRANRALRVEVPWLARIELSQLSMGGVRLP
jgi:hypothetical protein